MATGKITKPVDIYDNGTYTEELPAFGWITSSGTLCAVYFLFSKSTSGKTISNVSATDNGQCRMGYGGYLSFSASNVTPDVTADNYMRLGITKSSGYGVTNNSTFFGIARVTFTVS